MRLREIGDGKREGHSAKKLAKCQPKIGKLLYNAEGISDIERIHPRGDTYLHGESP